MATDPKNTKKSESDKLYAEWRPGPQTGAKIRGEIEPTSAFTAAVLGTAESDFQSRRGRGPRADPLQKLLEEIGKKRPETIATGGFNFMLAALKACIVTDKEPGAVVFGIDKSKRLVREGREQPPGVVYIWKNGVVTSDDDAITFDALAKRITTVRKKLPPANG